MRRLLTVQTARGTFAVLVPAEVSGEGLDIELRSSPDVFTFRDRGLVSEVLTFHSADDQPAAIVREISERGRA